MTRKQAEWQNMSRLQIVPSGYAVFGVAPAKRLVREVSSTVIRSLYCHYPLKLISANFANSRRRLHNNKSDDDPQLMKESCATACWLYVTNYGGGIVCGDHTQIEIEVWHARCNLSTDVKRITVSSSFPGFLSAFLALLEFWLHKVTIWFFQAVNFQRGITVIAPMDVVFLERTASLIVFFQCICQTAPYHRLRR